MPSCIVFDDVSKVYRINRGKGGKGLIGRFLQNKELFWALKNVNIDIKKGESIGLVGPNGAGKSTLLKLLSKVTRPTSGKIQVHGKIGALIELGAGFHPELTGRENIFLNGAILGISRKELKEKIDGIIDFAGIEQFIDTPIKRYSSGMLVRLGFAVSTHINPDILLVDEVLAVGDMAFQKKCFEKIRSFRNDEKTFILVSHSLYHIESACKRCIYLNRGTVVADGPTWEVLDSYRSDFGGAASKLGSDINNSQQTADIEILSCKLIDSFGNETNTVNSADPIVIEIYFDAKNKIKNPKFEFGFNRDGIRIGQTNNIVWKQVPNVLAGPGKLEVHIDSVQLSPGKYTLELWVSDMELGADLLNLRAVATLSVKLPPETQIATGNPGYLLIKSHWKWGKM